MSIFERFYYDILEIQYFSNVATMTLRFTTGSDTLQVDDVMEDEELKFGPNGGLVFCLEFLLENISWLEEALDSGKN